MGAGPVVEELRERIAELLCERQDLRAFGASRVWLERNRTFVRSHWDLSQVLIERHAREAAERTR